MEIKIDYTEDCGEFYADFKNLPSYATEGSSGIDLKGLVVRKLFTGSKELPLKLLEKALEKGRFTLRPFERVLLGTGLKMQIPEGFELQIRPRSGNSLKRGVYVAFGTIDSDYRGEIGIILMNCTSHNCNFVLGEKFAQGVLSPITKITSFSIGELEDSTRNEGGFGHTGK
jgi:dUTP pyrophosphatase